MTNVDSKEKKFERVNKKTNLFNFLPRLFWKIVNIIRYQTVYFFDTNFAVSSSNSKDKRIKKLFTINKKYILSEPIYCEVKRKLEGENKDFIANANFKFAVTSINEIKEVYPKACPLYYNFIIGMHNPAIINSPSFWGENFMAHYIKKIKPKGETNSWKRLMDRINRAKQRNTNCFNEPMTEEEYLIDDAFHRTLKKKRNSIIKNNESYINDHKNIALALVYSLLYKQNVYLLTSDHDAIYYFLLLMDVIIQECVFVRLILDQFQKEPMAKQKVIDGGMVSLYLNKKEFDYLENNLRADFLGHDWKKGDFRFGIKFWNIEKQKYYNNLWINFDENSLELLTTTYGGVTCPFVRNTEYGNWFNFRYFWPPPSSYELSKNLIKIEVKKKEFISRTRKVPWIIHNPTCHYSALDQAGKLCELSGFSEFIDPNYSKL